MLPVLYCVNPPHQYRILFALIYLALGNNWPKARMDDITHLDYFIDWQTYAPADYVREELEPSLSCLYSY